MPYLIELPHFVGGTFKIYYLRNTLMPHMLPDLSPCFKIPRIYLWLITILYSITYQPLLPSHFPSQCLVANILPLVTAVQLLQSSQLITSYNIFLLFPFYLVLYNASTFIFSVARDKVFFLPYSLIIWHKE